MLPGHRRLDDRPLHGLSCALVQRLRAEVLEAEPPRELLAGIVTFPTPVAVRVGACGIAQTANDSPRLRKLVADPRWHDRVASGHRQPCQRVRQSPTLTVRSRRNLACVGPTDDSGQPCVNRLARVRIGWPQRTAQAGEEGVEAGSISFLGGEPVPGGNQIRCFPGDALQCAPLVAEKVQRETGIELGIVQAPAFELSVLVVLHQVVIGVSGKSERIESQRVHRRHAQKPEVGLHRLELRKIEGDKVVPEQKGRSLGKRIQLVQCCRQVAALKHQAPARIGAQCGEGANATVPDADFEVQRHAARRKAVGVVLR